MSWVQSCLQQQGDILQTVTSALNMPQPEILSFSGKPTDYWKFIRNFETNVASRVKDDNIKLSYLIQNCKGDARECIEDCVVLTVNGYSKAREILHKRYGRPHVIARAYINELIEGPQIKGNDSDALMYLSVQMQRCELTLNQMSYSADMNNSQNMLRIVRRMPMHMRTKWADRADSIIESGSEPNFSHLTRFIEQRARVANTMYGKDISAEFAKINNKPRPNVSGSYRHTTTLATQSQNSSNTNRNVSYHRRVCVCVHCSEHNISMCTSFKSKSYDSRRDIMDRNKLCFNCFEYGHYARGCMDRSMCEIPGCTWKHHTLLHPPSRQQNILDRESTYVKGRGNDDYGNQERSITHDTGSQQKSTVTDMKIGNDSSGVYVSTGAGKSVCLRVLPVKIIGTGDKFIEVYTLLDEGSDTSLCTNELVNV